MSFLLLSISGCKVLSTAVGCVAMWCCINKWPAVSSAISHHEPFMQHDIQISAL